MFTPLEMCHPVHIPRQGHIRSVLQTESYCSMFLHFVFPFMEFNTCKDNIFKKYVTVPIVIMAIMRSIGGARSAPRVVYSGGTHGRTE